MDDCMSNSFYNNSSIYKYVVDATQSMEKSIITYEYILKLFEKL